MSESEATERTSATRQPPLRVWPSILALMGILPLTAVVAGLLLAIAAEAEGALSFDGGAFEDWLEKLQDSPGGVFLLLLPSQLVLLAAAFAPASLSRLSWRRRLALDTPPASGKVLAASLLGTLGVAYSNGWLVTLVFPEPSEAIESLTRMFIEPGGLYGVLLVVVLSVVPGVCEELFFRGYAQSRLVARWGGWRGIVLPSLFFVLLHLDPQHMLNILPIGFWLGFVAWRTGSTWTSVLCHAFNNFVMISIAKVALALADPSELENTRSELDAPTVATSLAGAVVAVLAMRVILRNTQPAPGAATR